MQRHPLQRLASPARTLSLLVHLVGLASFSGSFAWLQLYPNVFNDSFGWHWQFLTIIGLSMAWISFACGVLADVTLLPVFFHAKNFTSVCSAPLEVLITALYWGISLIDSSLLFPPDMQLPFLADVGFHAMPAVMLTADLLLLSPPWTIQVYGAGTISMTIAFLYWGWVELCFSKNGWYPYPLFALLTTPQRVLLFTFSACLMTGSAMVLKRLYGALNGQVQKLEKEALSPAKMD